jgi:hypothetical protein
VLSWYTCDAANIISTTAIAKIKLTVTIEEHSSCSRN